MGPRSELVTASGSRWLRAGLASGVVALALVLVVPAAALAPFPAPGTATIDGDPGEWRPDDLFTTMQHSGSTKVVGTLSLRYDCTSRVLSALVLASGGALFHADRPESTWIRIDGTGMVVSGESGNDGTPPDFAWVGRSGTAANGFEANAVVAPGEHTIRVHILMFDDSPDGYLTIDSHPRTGPLSLTCPSGSVEPSGSVKPSGGVGETPGPTPSGAPSPTPSVPPTGVPSPSQPGMTPPPTDLGGEFGASLAITSLWLMVIGLAVLNGVAFVVARSRVR